MMTMPMHKITSSPGNGFGGAVVVVVVGVVVVVVVEVVVGVCPDIPKTESPGETAEK